MILEVLGTETLQNEISYTGNEGLSTPSLPAEVKIWKRAVP